MSSNRVLSIYNSRRIILDHLENLGYDVSEYIGFSINEVDAMVQNSQHDMLIPGNDNQVYVKYLCGTTANTKLASAKVLVELIEDLYINDSVLEKNDTLILIIDGEPNKPLLEKVKYLYDRNGYFVVVHNIQRLQFNIREHSLVPKTRVLNKEETQQMMRKYNINTTKMLPEVSRFDPVSLAICMRPGDVCEIMRPSPTATETAFYRVCV
jgi:DNA-directed RNA polymerase subunit H (RpoH/RPB5)